jgi:ubiquitin fusion degradation protein 1
MENIFFAVPCAFIEEQKYDIEESSNIVLPNSFLTKICNDDNYQFPYQFEIEATNKSGNKKIISVSVVNFTADEETVILPFWVFENLGVNPYDPVLINYKKINPGKYLKIQPHQMKFIEHNNPDPREILEKKLSNFSCLTIDTIISFMYDGEIYKFNVLDIKDETGSCHSISLINIDLNIDFERPLDKPKAPTVKPQNINFSNKTEEKTSKNIIEKKNGFVAFSGAGFKLGNS